MNIEIITSIDSLAHTLLNSVVFIAIVWISVWSYSLYTANKQHKQIMSALKHIARLGQRTRFEFYEVK